MARAKPALGARTSKRLRPPRRRGRVIRDPVLGDVDAPAQPHAVVPFDVIEKSHEGAQPSGPPGQTHVKPHRHHPGGVSAFRVEHVEGIPEVDEEVLGGAEALRCPELHVVVVERIGDHEVRLALDRHPVGQVVVVGVAVVEEATFLDQQGVGCSPSRADRVCQPTGRVPVTAFIAATVRAMRSRSSDSSRSACPSQRQPWAEISWPRRTASSASGGSRSTGGRWNSPLPACHAGGAPP